MSPLPTMLSDLFAAFTTPLSPPLRALGYLDETLAMRRRAKRNLRSWQSHLDRTRGFVLSVAERCRRRNKAVIVGSGLLLDAPLAQLSDLFLEVELMDVVCLPAVRKEIERYPNVRFVEYDATGVAEPLYRLGRSGTTTLPEPSADSAAWNGADLVVSLNILSQLWVVPRAYVVRHLPLIEPEAADDWCSRIVKTHYAALRRIDCDVCLVGDFEYVMRDAAGQIISRNSTVHGLLLPASDESWIWNIVPIGRDSPHASKELVVGAWHFVRENEVGKMGG